MRPERDDLSMGHYGAARCLAARCWRLASRLAVANSNPSASISNSEPRAASKPRRRAAGSEPRAARHWHQNLPPPTGFGIGTPGAGRARGVKSLENTTGFGRDPPGWGNQNGSGVHYRTVGACVVPGTDPDTLGLPRAAALTAVATVTDARRRRHRQRRAASRASSNWSRRSTRRFLPAPPSRRVTRPSPQASEINNVVVFVKDAPRNFTLPTMTRARCGRRVKTSFRGGRDHARIVRRVPERGSVLPQRLFAVARRNVRSRALPSRRQPLAHVHQAGARQGLLPPALADEREHHGLRSRALRDSRTRRALRARPMCRPASSRLSAWHERIGESAKQIVVEAGPHGDGSIRAAGGDAVMARGAPATIRRPRRRSRR